MQYVEGRSLHPLFSLGVTSMARSKYRTRRDPSRPFPVRVPQDRSWVVKTSLGSDRTVWQQRSVRDIGSSLCSLTRGREIGRPVGQRKSSRGGGEGEQDVSTLGTDRVPTVDKNRVFGELGISLSVPPGLLAGGFGRLSFTKGGCSLPSSL